MMYAKSMPAMFRGKMGDSLMVNLMPLNEEEKQQLAANPHNANAIVFNRGMNMAKMIGFLSAYKQGVYIHEGPLFEPCYRSERLR